MIRLALALAMGVLTGDTALISPASTPALVYTLAPATCSDGYDTLGFSCRSACLRWSCVADGGRFWSLRFSPAWCCFTWRIGWGRGCLDRVTITRLCSA